MDNKMMEFIKSITDYSDATILHLYQTWLNAKSSNPKEPETVHGNEAEKGVCECSGVVHVTTDENNVTWCLSCKRKVD